MRTDPIKSVTYCFDLQQVHYLPKLTVSEAFYKRQLSFYAFCVTDVKIKNTNFYNWLEIEGNRGANEISSALINDLNERKSTWPTDVETVRLFSDGCPGQNKNRHILHAISLWLSREAPPSIRKVVLHFPVRGHSYLPADRTFGLIEKEFKKIKEILLPEEYQAIYAKFGNVKQFDTDWKIRNYKALAEHLKPATGIKEMKRVIVVKNEGEIAFRMETNYSGKDSSKRLVPIAKPKKSLDNVALPPVESAAIPLPSKEAKDIRDLLQTRFGSS